MIRFVTINKGQRVAVWDQKGDVRFIDGPRRLLVFRKTIQELPQFSAEAGQYLAVRYRDGHAEHIRGPASIWLDPVLHETVLVKPATSIDAHEAVVVYERQTDETVSRRVLRGPAQYVPNENEWLHSFHWHGANPKAPTHKIPNALNFTKLRVIPDQMYFDVTDARTADDALLVIKVMVFFELVDIERMLEQTHDPVADFINALTADIIDFVGSSTFEQFKQKTEVLNELDQYPNLTSRAERIGYKINKVVYRGYIASNKLQAMHDAAIETRTELKLEAETEAQAQDLADLKLMREAQRTEEQRAIERAQGEHEQTLKRMAHAEEVRQRQVNQEQRMVFKRELNQLELDHERAQNEEQAGYLKAMQDMQVDLTRYLVAQYQNPDRLVRIDGTGGSQLHLHE